MTYIIAEVGGNHDGELETAFELIHEAKACGCDAVKFQIYQADKLVTKDLPAFSQAKGYKYQYDRFKALELPDEYWHEIVGMCNREGIDFLATCFDLDTLHFWSEYMDMIKIASGDITYKALIEQAGKYNKPVILSTGMATFEEVQQASRWVPEHLLTILHCVSTYPTPDEQVNIDQITKFKQFYRRVGYSDHAMGISACLAAIALGATVIEKHFTLDNSKDYGDHPHSANPAQMAELVEHARRITKMYGNLDNPPCETEHKRFRRGGYAARDMRAGELIAEEDVMCLRPANLLPPHQYIGRVLKQDIKQGESLDGTT